MTSLPVFRDDGPLAGAAARAAPGALPLGPLILTIAGALPLVAVLVAWRESLPPAAVGLPALAWLIALTGAGGGCADAGRLAWMLPPLLRALEYGVLIRITSLAEPGAMPACFAVLGVLAFHHYDTFYRLRQQGAPPPAWTRSATGGWDGRLLIAYLLGLAGGLGTGLAIAAALLALAFGTESVASWVRFAGASARTMYDDDQDLEAG
jgi:hypothetical protein